MTSPATSYRLGLAVAVLTALFLLLGIGALGIIGDGGEDDRVYLGVLVVLVVGTLLARFKPRGMALALAATALTQVLATALAFALGVPDGASVLDVLALTVMYAGLFALSAWLFRRSTDQRVGEPVSSL
jgi:hypothetical protein